MTTPFHTRRIERLVRGVDTADGAGVVVVGDGHLHGRAAGGREVQLGAVADRAVDDAVAQPLAGIGGGIAVAAGVGVRAIVATTATTGREQSAGTDCGELEDRGTKGQGKLEHGEDARVDKVPAARPQETATG